jgi:glutathione S-transferase
MEGRGVARENRLGDGYEIASREGRTVKLYYTPGTSSLFPHIILREAGLEFELIRVDEHSKRTEDGKDYRATHPLGFVPALELADGTTLTEGVAISQYIADQVPAKALAPPNGTLARTKLQSWLNFIATEVQMGCFCQLFHPTAAETQKAMHRERLGTRLAHIERNLRTREHMLGEQFSLADAYIYVVLNWSRAAAVDLTSFPLLLALRKRVAARPAVQAAMEAEGLAYSIMR